MGCGASSDAGPPAVQQPTKLPAQGKPSTKPPPILGGIYAQGIQQPGGSLPASAQIPPPPAYNGGAASAGPPVVPGVGADVAAPAVASTGKHHAIIIGINYFGTKAQLNGTDDDAKTYAWMAQNVYGYSKSDIQLLTDTPGDLTTGDPTKANIMAAIANVVANVKPGDTIFFAYAGHGTSVPGANVADEADGMNEALVPMDYATAGVISDDDLFTSFLAPLAAGVRVIAVFDCCHSGTMMDLMHNVSATSSLKSGAPVDKRAKYAADQWQTTQTTTTNGTKTCAADVIMLAAAYDSQTAAEDTSGGTEGGAFTKLLRGTLARMGWSPVAKDLLTDISQRLAAGGYSQRPLLACSRPELVNNTFELGASKPVLPATLPW